MPDSLIVRAAVERDVDAVVAVVNEAYQVEAFFVGGNRIAADEVRSLIAAGECLIIERDGRVAACVQVAMRHGRGYFGMLAVATSEQRRGLGRRLIAEAESRALAAGCRVMDIKVVNLRTDLVSFYASLGYTQGGTEPYVHRPVLQPCHFVLMEKVL